MSNNFLINSDDKIFKIQANDNDTYCSTYRYGDDSNCLEIVAADNTRYIQFINCMYLDKIHFEKLSLPGYTDLDGIELVDNPLLYHKSDVDDYVSNFEIILNNNELGIILMPDYDPCFYYIDGRVEYYYDDCMSLTYIKVVNLSEVECNYFKNFVKEDSLVK